MKVLITTGSFGQYDPAPLEKLKRAGAEIISNPYGKKLSLEQSLELYSQNIDGVIAGTEEINAQVLQRAKSLKIISRCGIGLDNVDLAAAKKMNINVFKTSLAVTDAVAELTLGLILNSLRFISYADRILRKGEWQKPMGFLLKGKTVGILGFGAVGKKFVQLCAPFGCHFLAYDILPDDIFAKQHHVSYGALDDILKKSDIITVHLPFNPQTNNLISEEKLKLMKKDAFLINTARGGIVNEDALYQVLKEKRIAGAAFDVFAQEPYTGNLLELDNIILTSHIGSYAREARVSMEHEAVDNLIKGLKL